MRSLIAVGTAPPLGRLDDEDAVVANQTHHTQDLNRSATNAVTRTGVQLETAAAYGQEKVTTQRVPFTENGAQRIHSESTFSTTGCKSHKLKACKQACYCATCKRKCLSQLRLSHPPNCPNPNPPPPLSPPVPTQKPKGLLIT